jgi:UDP-glucuronate 4-epimerase
MKYTVIGVDSIDDYYNIELKYENLGILSKYDRFHFIKDDIRSTKAIERWKPSVIIHLASLAGVRNSIDHPKAYIQVNIEGFIHILEEAVKYKVSRVIYASSSSVYGLNSLPFREEDDVKKCNSPYACSKLAMENFAKMYNQLYGISCIGLRFFTVYGPRGRPDMAPYKFMNAIMKGEPIDKHGDGSSSRDYTYIDDIVRGIIAALHSSRNIKCEIYNLGNSTPVTLNEFIETCEKVVGKKAIVQQKSDQLGDVPHTLANIEKANRDLHYNPHTKLTTGLANYFHYLKTK